MSQTLTGVLERDYFRTRDGHVQWTVLAVTYETIDQVPFVRFRVQAGGVSTECVHSVEWFLKDVAKTGGIQCKLIHRFNAVGKHQLVLVDLATYEVLESGKWVNQFCIARLGKWAAVTEYYGWGDGAPFPAEVFEIASSSVEHGTDVV